MTVVPNHSRPIADDLFTWPSDEPQLIASKCRDCATVTFPRQTSCPNCAGRDVEVHLLARRGTLWTYTVQNFRPKAPFVGADAAFAPYAVGYIDLAGEVLVESRLVMTDLGELRIGAAMELVMEVIAHDGDGAPTVTFAFAPLRGRGVDNE